MPTPLSIYRSLPSVLLMLLALFAATSAAGQGTVPAVLLSDIHFDPFHDPAKMVQLRAAPVEQWAAIFKSATSPTQAAELEALQAECHERALDTPWPLLQGALTAAHDAEPHPVFVTLTGDLLAHEFPCRFHQLAPMATAEDLSAFAAKTVAFVVLQLRQAFPHVPVYTALGNNDSGCADYRETPGDAFLQSADDAMVAGAGARVDAAGRVALRAQVSPEGDYSVALPAPFQRTRLIVLEDIFEARQFNTCGAAADRSPERAQTDWLRAQLSAARAHGEHAWVMAHIPPGIDVYASFHRYVLRPNELCSAEPQPFFADGTLADTLLDYSDVVRLALFGHTHMDEIRLLHRAGDNGADVAIPAKLVPSVTPYFGNHPAFLVASIDPHTAVLKDWRTMVSPGPEGSTPPWTEGYRFSTAYHLPDFSAASATELADGFASDRTGQAPRSLAFRQHFYAGDFGLYALGLGQIWPAYACAIREQRPAAFHDCLCPASNASPRP